MYIIILKSHNIIIFLTKLKSYNILAQLIGHCILYVEIEVRFSDIWLISNH